MAVTPSMMAMAKTSMTSTTRPSSEVARARTQSADAVETPVVLSSLRPDCQWGDGFVASVAKAYQAGMAISFAGLFAGETRRRVSLPGYPFQRRRHWIEAGADSSTEG